MASIERTADPRFKRTPTPHNLHALYTPTDAEIAFAQRAARSRAHQLLIRAAKFERGIMQNPGRRRIYGPARFRSLCTGQ
jgi:hypothetical protein